MPINTIDLQTAQDWARTYRRNPANTIKGHLIPRVDLEQLLACAEGVDVRAYFGIDERGEEKLMIVSTDADGNDLINDARGQHIYDRSQACPSVCDVNSPLFIL
jgi:hypothetical protein